MYDQTFLHNIFVSYKVQGEWSSGVRKSLVTLWSEKVNFCLFHGLAPPILPLIY